MKRLVVYGLGSRVARRLFGLLVLAALLPVAALGLFAYAHVSDTLVDLNYRRLQQDAKSSGMNLVQRLLWREQSLRHGFEHLRGTVRAGQTLDDHAYEGFESVRIVGSEARDGLPPPQRAHLDRGSALLQIHDSETFMLVAIPNSPNLIKGSLDADMLWGSEEMAQDYCVLTPIGARLYCAPGFAAPPAGEWATLIAAQNAGTFPWQAGSEEHLAAWWRGQLQASFASDGFIMMVSAPRQETLAALAQFRQTFPAIVILALALAALLALVQIRRQFEPLQRLQEGTRRLAQGDFASRIEIRGKDEFASLADSFNRMAESLDRKFHLVQALGELDRAILAVSEMDYVVATLLQHAQRALPCDGVGVLRFDVGGQVRLAVTGGSTQECSATDLLARPEWHQDSPCFQLTLDTSSTCCLAHFSRLGATQALIFPAHVDGRLDNALVLAYRQLPDMLEEAMQAGSSLADRLSVVASNFAWEDKLYRQAHYDSLTGLPNRVMLRDRVQQALLRAEREGQSVALMLIDLDDFKSINDSLGHSAGDALLVACARRFGHVTRHTDTTARLGGDEFVVLIPDLPPASAVAIVDRVANSLCAELAQPVDLDGRLVSSTASVGIALYPDNGTEVEDLMKNADAAMYDSKRERHGGYRFYSDQMNLDIKVRFEIAQDLRKALDAGEFFLVYQPKIDVATGRVAGAEALIRWRSPRLGLVSPAHFIPVMDDIGLGDRLGEWVIDTACAQLAAWDAQGHPPVTVSVNVSPAQFRSEKIIAQVGTALTRNALAATRIELEILESMAAGESGSIFSTLESLRAMDIGIALDDFGTGYSSLVYLTQLPANVLKIDRGFIIDLATDVRQQAIVERIISLAHALGLTVVAEGIEERDQARVLAGMGCDTFQGYLFSKPLPPEEFAEFMHAAAAAPLPVTTA